MAESELNIRALRHCPFCGVEPVLKDVDEDIQAVICKSEICVGSGLIIAIAKRNGSFTEAIKAWNTRVYTPPKEGEKFFG